MIALTRQLRAEWRKLRTLRSTWAVLGIGLIAELVLRTVSAAIAPAAGGVAQVTFALRPSIVFGIVAALLPLLLLGPEWYAWSPSAWVDALAGQEIVNPDLLPPAAAGACSPGWRLWPARPPGGFSTAATGA